MARHYLDYASTTPLRGVAREAVVAWLEASSEARVGDPGRIHVEGMAARAALEEARLQVAILLGARGREVVFTSGATEAIAAATWGALTRGDPGRRHVVLGAIEHSAVRESSQRFATALGGDTTVVGCDRFGRIDPDELLGSVRPDTALVHLQWGNHEVGTIQPVAEVVERCRAAGVLVHLDAAQAAGRVPIAFDELGRTCAP